VEPSLSDYNSFHPLVSTKLSRKIWDNNIPRNIRLNLFLEKGETETLSADITVLRVWNSLTSQYTWNILNDKIMQSGVQQVGVEWTEREWIEKVKSLQGGKGE
jgi:hypothetical protein